MNRRIILAGVSALVLPLVGCSSGVVGTWSGTGAGADAPFTFGSVSFVGDKTFTAEAKYSGTSRVQSGTWETKGEELMLKSGDTNRQYKYKVEGQNLVVTDPKTGHAITLVRMKH